jgi:sulfatase modifying factor 1
MAADDACCAPTTAHAPSLRASSTAARPAPGRLAAADRHTVEQVTLAGGWFRMGDSTGDRNVGDGEGPVHPVHLSPFAIDATTVTNDAFARFVADTGYVTEAESFGFSAVFHLALAAAPDELMGPASGTPWWVGVRGADWRHPGGSRSDLDGLGEHPVVHVSWNDALAYTAWAGRRLPTEAEWEYASRGGLDGARYPWGDDLTDPLDDPLTEAGRWRCNIWQGRFPTENTAEDGYLTTAPVRAFPPNGFGLYQTVGNVWEWCADWWHPSYYSRSPRSDPTGPEVGSARVIRGGSYLCHDSYCNRYRNAARSSNTPDSSMGNAGFRTVAAEPIEPL